MTASNRTTRATSFGAAADAYERGRPEYPVEVVDWLLPTRADCVIDVGAGTGKLTRLLSDRAERVIAVEPSPGMLTVLRRIVGDVKAVEGTAEAIPAENSIADAVLCAQAWHWVDPERASQEIARVLRPGGTLGLVWNFRDHRVPWVAALDRILNESNTAETIGIPDVRAPFGELEQFATAWTDTLTRAKFSDLILSRSFMINADETHRTRVLAETDALIADQGETIALPYVSVAFRAQRPASG